MKAQLRRGLSIACLGLLLGASALAAPADWNGIWVPIKPPAALRTDAGKLPPLLPEARKLYDQRVAARKAGDASFDGTTRCQPPGIPRAYAMGTPFEIQVEDRFVYMLFEFNRLLRVIELDISHDRQAQFAPYYFGWAVGKWQGETLVVDDILFNDTTLLDAAGLPHSLDMHVTERWQLEGKQLTASFTIDDPAFYSEPWTTRLTFKRAPRGTLIKEDVCLERLNLIRR